MCVCVLDLYTHVCTEIAPAAPASLSYTFRLFTAHSWYPFRSFLARTRGRPGAGARAGAAGHARARPRGGRHTAHRAERRRYRKKSAHAL